MKHKIMKKIIVVVFAIPWLTFLSQVHADYVSKYSTLDGYSLVGLNVLNVTFNASGYSDTYSGSVSNMYFTDWAWFPNMISNRSTWKSSIPYGQRANGTVHIGVGVNSPWGAVNLWGGQNYFSLDF